MATNIWKTGTKNAFTTSLNGSITDSDTTITLTSTDGLQAPGIIVIDRIDANNNSTPALREYISFTDISSNSLLNCTRGLAGSTAQIHTSGAQVEETWTVTHWGDFLDSFAVSHNSSGAIVTASMATVADLRVWNSLNMSGASVIISDLTISSKLYASGASMVGSFGTRPVWVMGGNLSGPTTGVGKPLPMMDSGNWQYLVAVSRTPASAGSIVLDINKNGTSIFDTDARLTIPGGSAFVSTASIKTKSFTAGDVFTVDIDIGAYCDDITIVARG